MKQIEIIRTYSQKRCLIVDDVPDIRTSLKRMLTDFGCKQVDTAGNAEEAIDLCERAAYDLLIADYNLGAGKNGQQLLEELRFRGLLSNAALFIMITAENASQYVLHALEYQPDDYMSKPITSRGLRARLDQVLLRKEKLRPVNLALDDNKRSKAIAAALRLLEDPGKYRSDIQRVLGDLLCKNGDFPQALKLYKPLLTEKAPVWARLGYARALHGTDRDDEALEILSALTRDAPRCVEAHELIAEILESQNKLGQAQHAMSEAVALSPRSVERQREMGRISSAAGDDLAAVHSWRAAVRHGKNSSQQSPEDFTNLAGGLVNLGRANETGAVEQLATEAMDALRKMERRFPRQPVAKVRGKLAEADVFSLLGNQRKAEACTEEAMATYDQLTSSVLGNSPVSLCLDCAQALIACGKYEHGEQLLRKLAEINKDPDVAIRIDKMLREPLTREGVELAARLNKRGINFYQNKRYGEAVNAFKNVLRELPNHIGLNLNLIQALVSKAKNTELNREEMSLIEQCFQRIGQPEAGSAYASRVEYLRKQVDKMGLQEA